MQQQVHYMSPPPVIRPHSLIEDVYCGAVRGEFDDNLGPVGYTTLAIFGFIPVIGSVCAIRDLFASRRNHDAFGTFINIFAIIPVIGGFFKAILALRNMGRARMALKARHSQPR